MRSWRATAESGSRSTKHGVVGGANAPVPRGNYWDASRCCSARGTVFIGATLGIRSNARTATKHPSGARSCALGRVGAARPPVAAVDSSYFATEYLTHVQEGAAIRGPRRGAPCRRHKSMDIFGLRLLVASHRCGGFRRKRAEFIRHAVREPRRPHYRHDSRRVEGLSVPRDGC